MRALSVRERWAAALVGIIMIVVANLAFVALAFPDDEPQPLSLGNTELRWYGEQAVVDPAIRNDGDSTVELLSVSAPGARVMRSADQWVVESDRLLPVAGLKIAPGGREWVEVSFPNTCPRPPKLARLDVRLRVDGREVTQTLPVPPLYVPPCA